MLMKTHMIICLFFILVFFNFFCEYFDGIFSILFFIFMVLFGCLVPDVDSRFSKLGRKKIFRGVQFFVKHRGMFHSFFFLVILCFILWLFLPCVVLPFFMGYFIHLFADCFTVNGIRLFYPFQKRFCWRIKTGGFVERLIFFVFLFLNIFLCFIFVC